MKRVGWARRARRVLIAIVIILALATGAWLTGWPQERSIEWQFRRNFGGIAVVEWGGLGSDLRFKRVEIYPDRRARRERKPILVAENVAVAYQLLPDDDRMLRSVRIERAFVSIDITDPEAPNYTFLTQRLGAETKDDAGAPPGTQFMPRDLVIEDFGVSVSAAQGRATLGPLRIDADLLKPESPHIQYASRRAVIAWESTDGEVIDVGNVTIDGAVALENDRATLAQVLDAPGLAYTVLDGSGDFSAETPEVHVKVGEFTLAGGRLAAFLDALDSPIRFDEFDVESCEGRVALGETLEFNVKSTATVLAPALAAAAEPLYGDIARLNLEAEQTDTLNAQATLMFAQNQALRATMTGNEDAGAAKITSESWTRDQLVNALPAAFRSGVGSLGFETFTADADIEWTAEEFTARARASSQGGGSETPPIGWTLDARGPRDTFAGIEGTLEAQIGERRLHATATAIGEDRYRAEARIETVQLAPWVQLIAGDEAAESVQGTIEGTVTAEINGKDAPIEIVPDIHLRAFAYNELNLDEIAMGGAIQYDRTTRRLAIPDLHAEAIDGMTMFKLAGFSYDAERERGEGEFTAGANLGVLGAAFGAPDLFGSSSAEGRMRIDGADAVIACVVKSDYAGLGEVLLPYGAEVTGEVEIAYDLDSATGALTQCNATIGAGTALHLTDTTFALEPLRVTGQLDLDSDLQLLVAMVWLQAAEGALRHHASFEITDEGLFADWRLDAEAAGLILAGAVGSAEDALFEATGTYEDGLDGSGTITAGKITAAGGSATDAQGPVVFEDDTMRIKGAAGALFGGTIVADIDIGVLVEKLPIDVMGTFDGADLAILTDEVQPPNTSLTGTAAGNLAARYTTDGLETFTLNASAPDGLSVNRSLVADLLQSEKLLAGIADRVVDKTMDRLLGTAPQRPFDSGRLNLYLQGGKIQGTAELLSVKTQAYNGLNLTVNLDMDQSALTAALTLLEESKLGNVDF
jgi:hypothetical protein